MKDHPEQPPQSPRSSAGTTAAADPKADPKANPKLARAAQLMAELNAAAGRDDGPPPAPLYPLQPLQDVALARGRVHEFTGSARRTLAALAVGAAQPEGPVIWFRPAWRSDGFYPYGLATLMQDPSALIIAKCKRPVDVLWSMEESLRSGCIALVIGEIAEAPDLRQVRRLHMAADEGLMRNRQAGRHAPAPLGVMLGHETARSAIAGVESRWSLHHMPPDPALLRPAAPRWRLGRQLQRGQPPKDWELRLHPPPVGSAEANGPWRPQVLAL
ncbi:ImuA family protein [Pararhodobacter oceanensis]|uniref:ImuA family protein n=1 Tax=Pararhodobacter oceanensis TaxID=2172121 RepID=UPI0019825242|nr:hypothetical protein [Pararhodobacter oceanensis]